MKAATHVYTPLAAMAMLIANMIGTGVFTSLGFQLQGIDSPFVLLSLWLVGGITALCGALSYAELGAALPRSGGEYHFLSECWHPSAGFVAGWISSTIGFAAPVALAAITFSSYLVSVFPWLSIKTTAVALIILLTLLHSTTHRRSGVVQTVFTMLKLLMIMVFIFAGYYYSDKIPGSFFLPQQGDGTLLLSSSFAVSLIYVNYAYNGWNSATYLAGELKNPQKALPVILFAGTAVVALCYLLLNAVFLYSTPMDLIRGKLEVAYVVAEHVFGDHIASWMGILMALLLVSTVSAMIMAGPRVLAVMGEDYDLFDSLARKNKDGIPVLAISLQSVLSIVFVITSSFESVLIVSAFALGLCNFFTVAGVIALRMKKPTLHRPYKTFLYPFTPILFLSLMTWTLLYLLIERTGQSLVALLVVVTGFFAWWMLNRTSNGRQGKMHY